VPRYTKFPTKPKSNPPQPANNEATVKNGILPFAAAAEVDLIDLLRSGVKSVTIAAWMTMGNQQIANVILSRPKTE
jgi:hypothetical protein